MEEYIMAIYRQIQIDFWQDDFVTDLSAEDRYFFIYLLTNSKTTQCGVYQINVKLAAFELGWDREQVNKLLKRFVEYGKILYDQTTSELMLVNWLKYNKATSPKVAKVIDREIKSIKNEDFRDTLVGLCINYGYPIDTVSIPNRNNNKHNNKNNNNNQNNNQNEEQTEEANDSSVSPYSIRADEKIEEPNETTKIYSFGDVATFYKENVRDLNPHIGQRLGYMVDEYGAELTFYAIQVAIEKGEASKINYIEGILRIWKEKNYRTIDDVVSANKRFIAASKIKKSEPVPEWLGNQEAKTTKLSAEEEADLDAERQKLIAELAATKEFKHA